MWPALLLCAVACQLDRQPLPEDARFHPHGVAALRPLQAPPSDWAIERTVYIPVYSEIV